MMTRTASATLSILLLLSIGISAQHPDFSGRWALEAPAVATTAAVPGTPAAAAAPGDMGSGWGSPITITQDAQRLSVEYVFYSRYDAMPPLTFSYPLDGSEGRNIVSMGRGDQIELSSARWNGSTVAISTRYQVTEKGMKPFTAEVTRELSLESPTTLIVQVTRAGVLGGSPTTTRSVYRKAP